MLVVVRDRVAKLVKAGKSQGSGGRRAPDEGVRGKGLGGTSFNAEQWIGRAYVDQKASLEKRRKK